jgi:3-dehydroquinate synthetase
MLREPTALAPELLQRGVDIKSQIVVRDPTEQNERAVLNFGHTVGHALEKASGHQIPHGLAVARGMVIEGFLATRLCGFEPSELDRLIALLTALEIPLLDDIDPQAARAFLKSDKKRAAGQLRVALPRRIGQMAVEKLPESQTDEGLAEPRFTLAVEEEDVMQAWQAAKDRLAAAR